MKVIYLMLFLAMSNYCIGQSQPMATSLTKEDYLHKSRVQKTWGWVLAGTGAAVTVAGLVTLVTVDLVDAVGGTPTAYGSVLMVSGLAMVGGSIPLLIAAHRNKHKAYSVTIKNESAHVQSGSNFHVQYYPVVSVKFNL
jgi:hypothetical protein